MLAKIIQKDDIILIIGGLGYTGAGIARYLLRQGFRVRCTTRSLATGAAVIAKLEKEGRFEALEVPDWSITGAYDQALKGVAGVICVAGLLFRPDPQAAIDETCTAYTNLLDSCTKSASIKRVVVTSTRAAAYETAEDASFSVTPQTYNDSVLKRALEAAPDDPRRPAWGYMAGRVQGEHLLFDYVRERKPQFAVNTVMPELIIGDSPNMTQGTGRLILALFQGEPSPVIINAVTRNPASFVSLEDTARVHLAALQEPDVENERLFATSARPYTINEVFGIWRRHFPTRTFPDDLEGSWTKPSKIKVDNSRSTELLKRQGVEHWTSLEAALLDHTRNVV